MSHVHRNVTEMVSAARNSPALVPWSTGNEIPDSTSTAGLAVADRIAGAVETADDTRPLVIGPDKSRRVPAKGSAADLMLAELDRLALNYNTTQSGIEISFTTDTTHTLPRCPRRPRSPCGTANAAYP